MEFEWDEAKAVGNLRKHRVSFEEATTVFDDPAVRVRYDEDHSGVEDRWNAIGRSGKLRVLAVTYTRRGPAVRIISARQATRAEALEYAQA